MLNDWRAFTVEVLSKIDQGRKAEDENGNHLRNICQPLLEAALPWMPPDAQLDVTKQLHAIFRDAVALSQTLRCQRASWSVRNLNAIIKYIPKEPGKRVKHRFVSKAMRDVDDEGYAPKDQHGFSERYVTILIEPSLFKRGDADGGNFEVETCISPALVQCSKQVAWKD